MYYLRGVGLWDGRNINVRNLSFFFEETLLLIFFLNYFLILVFILVGVAFFTLFERKLLGYIHIRLGPNKVGFYGIFQPFADAVKLFSKEILKLIKFNFFLNYVRPLLGMFLCLALWLVYPNWTSVSYFFYSIIYFFCVSRLMVYFLLGSGWSRVSKYRLIGGYRAAAQAISYEVRMILILLGICWMVIGYTFFFWEFYQVSVFFCFIRYPMFFCWLIVCLAESNRSPFDFREGESELVSGFNTEYGGGLFSMIFITEYGSILFLGLFTSFFFMGGGMFFMVKAFLVSAFYVWVRGSFPRLRYDKLMMMAWKGLLPFVLSVMIYFFLVGNVY
jgi:NADH-ubiquinone oxidoreductase chain 1